MWAEDETQYMNFNDLRLNKRFQAILEDFTEKPSASIPEACQSNASTKGAYRFLSNNCVEAKEIREGHRQATIERMQNSPIDSKLLFISDATNLVYSSHKKLKGIGVLRSQHARGLNLHTTLVAPENELLLGIIHQVCWGRKEEDYGKRSERAKLPIEQKESFRWIEAFQSSQEALPDNMTGVFMGDRGADIYDLFLVPKKPNMNIIVRSAQKRKNADTKEPIFDELAQQAIACIIEVKVPRSGNRKERIARLEIRSNQITVASPKNKSKLPSITLNIVSATEIIDDVQVEDPIYWKLLTTLDINLAEDAANVVRTYAKRWLIERFHYTLKEGCQVEELQLEEAERIDKAIATYTIVSWRLMHVTYLARCSPDSSCLQAFSQDEWQALYCRVNKTPKLPKKEPTMKEMIMLLAKLGGFLGRKQDANPGVKVIWRGLSILSEITQIYCILTKRCG